jgi:hypothetical protein
MGGVGAPWVVWGAPWVVWGAPWVGHLGWGTLGGLGGTLGGLWGTLGGLGGTLGGLGGILGMLCRVELIPAKPPRSQAQKITGFVHKMHVTCLFVAGLTKMILGDGDEQGGN